MLKSAITEKAAVILAAGRGTRMGAATVNKVCFDCAGVPVIRRIVRNMRAGGVTRFVVVVGHLAESVMTALDGEPGVLWAYQKEQRGTGHAAQCGLKVLEEIGFTGSVIVSMGDKIVSPAIVRSLLARLSDKCVIGVQHNPGNTSKGHVVLRDGQALGIVEAKDIRKAREENAPIRLCGQVFTADEVAATPFVNAALYGFDVRALGEALRTLRSDNAQGEFYLTDAVEYFAARGTVDVYSADPSEMATYSTRLELRAIAHRYLRTASELRADPAHAQEAALLDAFIARYGDRPCVMTSAPGRVNLMGRHIEHRGGSVNMMATERRLTFVVAPRNDDVVRISNIDPQFPDATFRVGDLLAVPTAETPRGTAAWLDFLETPGIKADLAASRGHWVNYIKSAVLRLQFEESFALCGMDIVAAGDIPIAAGLSSSSALVVATAEAVVALNELNLPTAAFVDLCGEGEWYVGSRGGAGDHAAMKCSRAGHVTHLSFKPFRIGDAVAFPDGHAVLVVESGEQAKKAEGARETFNARVRDYETAFTEVKRHYPELPLSCFRDIAFLPPADIAKALGCLTGSVKGVATYGVKECQRAERCVELLKANDFRALGELMKVSHDGDRCGRGEYECSTPRIDALCDRLNAMPGVLGSQLVGAGLGGSVIALVESSAADAIITALADGGYRAFVSRPASGSRVDY